MKHNFSVILIVVSLFFVSQFVGLAVTDHYLIKPGKPVAELPLNIERPPLNEGTSFIPIFLFILLATGFILLIMKLKLVRLWKVGFFLSVCFCLTISFSAFMRQNFAIVLALVFTVLKVFRRSVFTHNFVEVFVYGALAAIFVPILNVLSAAILLVLISFYDWIAVRKTKHMIKMAKFQSKVKSFAGLVVPYKKSVAILGGGDIGFPLLFAGVVMKEFNFVLLSFKTFIVPFFVALSLLFLFVIGSKKKFYPAMPYLSVGCFLGYGVVRLVSLF